MGDRSAFDHVELIVWSGTGNTRRVADRFAQAAIDRGATARVLAAGSPRDVQDSERTLLGLLAPTHGFTATWSSIKAALLTPGVRGTDAFVLATRGGTRIAGRVFPGFEGTAAYLPAALLALRGARIRGVGAIDMPLNWTSIIPSLGPQGVADVVTRGDAQTDGFSGRLLDGETVFRGLAQLMLGILILPLSLGYMLIARFLLAKAFFADERCTSCGTCEKNCPQGAIHLRGRAQRPYWTYSCQNCMRCMSNCPTDAIQGGQAVLLFYIWLTVLPVGALVATFLFSTIGQPDAWIAEAIALLAEYAWILAAVWLAYAALWLGLLVPGLGFVLSRATLTPFYRRYRGPKAEG